MAEKTQFEVDVPTMDSSSIVGTNEKVSYYHLTHDKLMREIVLSQRYNYDGIGCYAL